MQIIEITGEREIELHDDENRLIGVYVPGQRYTVRDEASPFARTVAQWVDQGRAVIVEDVPGAASPAAVAGQGEVK